MLHLSKLQVSLLAGAQGLAGRSRDRYVEGDRMMNALGGGVSVGWAACELMLCKEKGCTRSGCAALGCALHGEALT